jgi:predicted short-subunit dehydrogenase-like oxidoreductase (DUF2520 family)
LADRQHRPEDIYINCSVKEYRISFIGAGKVAGALCRQFFMSGFKIQQIVTRTEKVGQALAESCNASWSADFHFTGSEDVIIAAVTDDKLPEVLDRIICHENTIVAHTAGSLGLDIFPSRIRHTGVFYPLQTFSENRKIEFHDLPFFLEATDSFSAEILKHLTESIGGKVRFVDTEHRRLLHIAAVFVCNFVNHMLTAGKQLTEKAGFQFEVMEPLIKETILKAMESGPENAQTGPAYRFDNGTIKKHIDLLSFSPELQDVYKEITRSIKRFYNNRK